MRNLIKRQLSAPTSTKIGALGELLCLESEGGEIVNSILQLESAANISENLVGVADSLAANGVDVNAVTDSLGQPVISSLEGVDEGLANEVAISLEDDKEGFWKKAKEKIKEIYEAIVEYIKRFINWIKSFFVKNAESATEAEKVIDEQIAVVKEMEAEVKKSGPLALEFKDGDKTETTEAEKARKAMAKEEREGRRMAKQILRENSVSKAIQLSHGGIIVNSKAKWAINNEGWEASSVIKSIENSFAKLTKELDFSEPTRMERIKIEQQIKMLKDPKVIPSEEIGEYLKAMSRDTRETALRTTGTGFDLIGLGIRLIGYDISYVKSKVGMDIEITPCDPDKSAGHDIVFKDLSEVAKFLEVLKMQARKTSQISKVQSTALKDGMAMLDKYLKEIMAIQVDPSDSERLALQKATMTFIRREVVGRVEVTQERAKLLSLRPVFNGISLVTAITKGH